MRKIIVGFLILFGILIFSEDGSVIIRSLNMSDFPHVSLNFSVKGPSGKFESDIAKSEVSVLEENERIPFTLKAGMEDIHVVVAVDVSGSLKKNMSMVKELLAKLMERISDIDLKVTICEFGFKRSGGIAFYGEYSIRSEEDRKKVMKKIESLRAFGSTPLYDAIKRSIEYLEKLKGIGLILVFTDGYDEDYSGKKPGSEITLEELLGIDTNVVIYTLGIPGNEGIEGDVLREISNRFNGEYFNLSLKETSLDVVKEKILESIVGIYHLEFTAGSGEYAILRITKPTYTAETIIRYPRGPVEIGGELILPAGYRGVVKISATEDKAKLISEKDLGCFVNGVSTGDDVVTAYCNDAVFILNHDLKVVERKNIENVVFALKTSKGLMVGIRGTGFELLGDEGKRTRVLECDLRKADMVGENVYAFCGDSIWSIDLRTMEASRKLTWRKPVKNFGSMKGALSVVDYGSGIYVVRNGRYKLWREGGGYTDAENGFVLDGLRAKLVYPTGKSVDLRFYPESLIRGDGFSVVLGWLGEIAVYNDKRELKLFIPSKFVPKLKVFKGRPHILMEGVVYELNNGVMEKAKVPENGGIYDVWGGEESILALGKRGLLVLARDSSRLVDIEAFRIGSFDDLILVHHGKNLDILNRDFRRIDSRRIGRVLDEISVTPYGACIPTSNGVIEITKKGITEIKSSWVKSCAVCDVGVCTLDEDVSLLNSEGRELFRIPVPRGIPVKLLVMNDELYVLTTTGHLYHLSRGVLKLVSERCLDATVWKGHMLLLRKVDNEYEIRVMESR